jgi:hypothetical protein
LRPGALENLCELDPRGPLYFIPTTRWVRALGKEIRRLKARRVLEVAAGDGFLSACLRRALPDVMICASDSGAWEEPRARMSATEQRLLRGVSVPGLRLGEDVVRLDARAAIRKIKPDLVLACWLPPGPLLDSLIRAPVQYVLEIGAAGGVTSSQWSWRFSHDFLTGPVETLARCRLDERPDRALQSRVTLYYGAAHPEHAVERVREGDWLSQFRPGKPAPGRKSAGRTTRDRRVNS